MSTPAETTTKARDEFLERGAMAMNHVLATMRQSGRTIMTNADFEAFTGLFNISNALARVPKSALVVSDGFAAGQQSADRIEQISKVADLLDGVDRDVATITAEAAKSAQQQPAPPRAEPEREPPANDADAALSEKAA